MKKDPDAPKETALDLREAVRQAAEAVEVDPETVDLAKLAKAVAELGKASVMQKRWLSEVRAKAEAAAANVEKIAKKGGLSSDSVEQLRREILGIAG